MVLLLPRWVAALAEVCQAFLRMQDALRRFWRTLKARITKALGEQFLHLLTTVRTRKYTGGPHGEGIADEWTQFQSRPGPMDI